MGSVAKDAEGFETTLKIEMAGELFACSGIQVMEHNYLEVYTFEKWSERTLPAFVENERIVPEI